MASSEDAQAESPAEVRYEKPTLTRLGTLGELTLGDGDGFDDGIGGQNGGTGSI